MLIVLSTIAHLIAGLFAAAFGLALADRRMDAARGSLFSFTVMTLLAISIQVFG